MISNRARSYEYWVGGEEGGRERGTSCHVRPGGCTQRGAKKRKDGGNLGELKPFGCWGCECALCLGTQA